MVNRHYFVHTLLRARDWQHRPQFDEVCDWWRGRGRGVCALVGMGGAGKTAIAERFLNELLEGSRSLKTSGAHSNRPNSGESGYHKLSPPTAVFVYSFYDDDKPENFFRHLQIWLEGNSAPDKQKSPTQLMFDIQQHQGLIVLDGLERVQESGARGGFGRLTSPSLRDLLNHIASGSARSVSVLVTSRFPLTDLRDSHPRFFHTIPIDQIELEAGVALLRERGVRGSDMQLAPIVEHCGRHALTIDLAGGYIKEYGHGDPSTPLNLGTAEELQAEAEQEPDDDKRAVLKQGIRFARIAQRYREAMLETDEAALALLERICLFRLGVDRETLAAIFTGPAAEKVSGKALASLDADQLQRKLDWLAKMRVVEAKEFPTSDQQGETRYTIHPALQDGFLNGISRDDAKASHEVIRQRLEVSLGDIPGAKPSDHHVLDLMEEIIHHALATGNLHVAWNIYQNRLGGCHNLIAKLNDFVRASRVTDTILRSHVAGDALPARAVTVLRSDYGYSCLELGRVVSAAQLLTKGVDDCRRTNDANLKTLSRNLACALTESGNLKRALETLRNSLPELRDPQVIKRALLQIAEIEMLRGNAQVTITETDVGRDAENLNSTKLGPLPITVRHDSLDMHRFLGEFQVRVEALSRKGIENAELAGARLDLSDRLLWRGDVDAALAQAAAAQDWAVDRNACRFLCHCALTLTRIYAVRHQAAGEEAAHSCAEASVTRGLRIVRDCGYGLYHIDLLLERARLQLRQGDAGAALSDIEVALDTGIPANEETGQVELLAANHEECGYAWAIPFGLQLRAEALLLKVAREVIAVGWAVPTNGTLAPIDVAAVGTAHPTIGQLIGDAQQLLHESLDRWHDLRDPEPTEDNNFKHPETGKEYNYRAAETFKVLTELERGILTRYPVRRTPSHNAIGDEEPRMRKYVYVSFSYSDDEFRRELRNVLKRDIRVAPLYWDDLELRQGENWEQTMRERVAQTKIMVMLVSPQYLDRDRCQAWKYEIPPALQAYGDGELTILWLPVRSVRAEDTPFPEVQSGHPLSRPLDSLNYEQRQAAYHKIRQSIVMELGLNMNTTFDTFLSHNSKDKPVIRELAGALGSRGLRPWLDERELVPGRPWQDALEEIIQNTKTAIVAVGPAGFGPWEEPEMRACLSEFVKRKLPVIPVLLPGAPQQPELPLFLRAFTWVDLRGGLNDEGMDRLVWGITGVKPGSLASLAGAVPHPPVTTQSESGPLATWKEKLEYLQEQEAIAADPAQKFALKKQIEEAQRKIRELR